MSKRLILALACASATLWAGAAQAGGVNWSIGINLPPIGAVISDGPAYNYNGYGYNNYDYGYAPAPVYAPPPVVYRAAPVYVAPRVVYRSVPRYVGPPVGVRPGWGHGQREWRGDRRDHWDGHRDGQWQGQRNDRADRGGYDRGGQDRGDRRWQR